MQITEQWDNNIPVYDFSSKPARVDIFRNPSRVELMKLIRDSEGKCARALVDGTDILVWDAYLTTHGDVQKHYPNARSIYLILHQDRVEFNDINYEYNEGDDYEEFPYSYYLTEQIAAARACPALMHIYGDFTPIGTDNDTGESVEMTHQWVAANCSPRPV